MIIQQSPPNVGPTVEDIARALELTDGLYTNPVIRPYEKKLQEQTAGLNRLFQGDFDNLGRVRWLVSGQSPRGDWGINKNGLVHVFDGLRHGKIAVGIVVLTKKLAVVNKCLITEIWEKVRDADWLDLGRGEFAWVDQSFNLIDRNRDRYVTDPDAPF